LAPLVDNYFVNGTKTTRSPRNPKPSCALQGRGQQGRACAAQIGAAGPDRVCCITKTKTRLHVLREPPTNHYLELFIHWNSGRSGATQISPAAAK
jgi:hypothetical protein